MYQNIVVAVDGSEYSHRALEHARVLADRFGATLHLVHIFPRTSDLHGYEDFEKFFSKRKGAGQKVLDEARRRLGDITFNVREELREDPAAEAIVAVAQDCSAELIVVGTRGLGAIKGLVIGSVSRKVLHTAACAVLVVH